jgi:hypothetical protein
MSTASPARRESTPPSPAAPALGNTAPWAPARPPPRGYALAGVSTSSDTRSAQVRSLNGGKTLGVSLGPGIFM